MMTLMSMKGSIASKKKKKDKIQRKTQLGPYMKKKKMSLGNVLKRKIINELPILVNFPVESLTSYSQSIQITGGCINLFQL